MADNTHNPQAENKKAENKEVATTTSKITQDVRDAHFREEGVNERNRAPKDKVFDEEGKASKRPKDEATE